ncbi:MAG: SDR family oxidoreductase [Actinomycetota bacterium]
MTSPLPRTALLTGAGGDIGRAVAVRLAARGSALVLTDLPQADDGLRRTAEQCAAAGGGVPDPVIRHGDVTDEAAVTELFDGLRADGIEPDLLFNNAGYQGRFANTVDYDVDDFRRVLEINVTGVMIVLQAFARGLIAAGRPGVVVNSASMAHTGAPNMAAYSASKAAVVALTASAAKDLAAHDIRVNCVSPAFIGPGAMWDRQVELQASTPSQYFADDPATVAEQMIESVPMRRYGSLEEVAGAVVFLFSEDAAYITAFNLEVSGGAAG